jgi:hypothetical protein
MNHARKLPTRFLMVLADDTTRKPFVLQGLLHFEMQAAGCF